MKYSRCHWIEVLGLEQHYSRADIEAAVVDDGVDVTQLKNIDRFAIVPRLVSKVPKWVRVLGTKLAIDESIASDAAGIVFVRKQGAWSIQGKLDRYILTGKRPGSQGPIDDAFATAFLCVRGTGKPWHAQVQSYADASLDRFTEEWAHYFRGHLPIKNDSDVTETDLKTRNLILFGDPGSNPWIARMLPQLPLTWTSESLRLGDQDYSASDHLPALIAPNPLAEGAGHYVVLNSGHSFHTAELSKLNYLLFPRWGDWAVLKIPHNAKVQPLTETVEQAGYFDEHWRPKMPQ